MAARKIVQAGPSLRYTSVLLEHYAANRQSTTVEMYGLIIIIILFL